MFWIGLIVALLILNILVVLHEFGHYLTAKFFKVTVFEFGIGFPPNIFTLWTGKKIFDLNRLPHGASASFEKGDLVSISALRDETDGKLYAEQISKGKKPETQIALSDASEVAIGKVRSYTENELVVSPMAWSLNLLPLGGFVKLLSDDTRGGRGNLSTKRYLAQITVLVAGVALNLIAPFVLFTINNWLPDDNTQVVIQNIVPTSPADEAGLLPNDRLLSIDGRTIDGLGDLNFVIGSRLGADTDWRVERMGAELDLEVAIARTPDLLVVGTDLTLAEAQMFAPNLQVGDTLRSGFVGLALAEAESTRASSFDFFGGIQAGIYQGVDLFSNLYNSTAQLITDRPDNAPILVGPAGVGQITGEIIATDVSWSDRISTLLLLAAIISLSLGILNLLPFPPLDGGKILFVVIRMINKGKPVSVRVQNALNLVGFAAFALLAVYVFFSDVTRIVMG